MKKSFNDWMNSKTYNEFVGPAGQVDPQGTMASKDESPAENNGGSMGIQRLADRLIQALSTKPPAQVIQTQQYINQGIQQMLMSKNKSAARKGVLSGFNDFRQAKQNFGRPTDQMGF